MRKIGNIVTKLKLEYPDYYNVYDTMDIPNDLPTLIVGFKLTLELFKDKIRLRDNNIEGNIYWTFTNRENRSKHEVEVELFKSICLENACKESKYVFVDVIHFNPKTLIKVAKKILSMKNVISYISKDMVYIYGENLIFGVDLHFTTFVGLERNKIISKIRDISEYTLDDEEIVIEYKDFLGRLNNQVKYLPILYSIKYGKS